ncbi:ATP-binding cassette domain-containing protein [uncultured Thiohalocapsa sp.]|uniref:ATP-binding cassette domain-containing protein n=1 Tax=uncultured Thiohalocapsa sp. TaxID=768990 RepID=UPI0025DEAB84|nr:ATP-binding cassette domain-containing protein [uncultured Thiohalocapsa sp.]
MSESYAPAPILLEGPNFSGRTAHLRGFVGLPPVSGGELTQGLSGGAFVAQDSQNFISGLATTGHLELLLHGLEQCPFREDIERLTVQLRLRECLDRNPFTLSGGEQAMLTVLSAAAMTPRRLALDGVLEQLSDASREVMLDLIGGPLATVCATRLADNRLTHFPGLLERFSLRPPGAVPALRPDTPWPGRTTGKVLTLAGIRFAYRRGQAVLDGIDFRLQPGRVYVLHGANGAGKSTLSKVLCGILRPRSGELLTATGQRVQPWREPAGLFAYHFQNPDLQLFHTRVRDELGLVGEPSDGGTFHLVHGFGLESVLDEHPLDLPYVLRKRVAMAATLAMFRPWTILDEPTLGQDDANCLALAAFLRRAAKAGAGIIVISHSRWFSAQLDAEHILLRGGRLEAVVPTEISAEKRV